MGSFSSRVEPTHKEQKQERIEDHRKDEETKKWLVMFYAPWHPPCNQFDPTFAQLSLEFSELDNKENGLTFAKFDLARWPGGGIDHGIDLTGNSKQLPTLILNIYQCFVY